MFDLELEWMVGGVWGVERRQDFFLLHHIPSLFILMTVAHHLGYIFFYPLHLQRLKKSKMTAIIVTERKLSFRPPKITPALQAALGLVPGLTREK